jgi:hypothetical protein
MNISVLSVSRTTLAVAGQGRNMSELLNKFLGYGQVVSCVML